MSLNVFCNAAYTLPYTLDDSCGEVTSYNQWVTEQMRATEKEWLCDSAQMNQDCKQWSKFCTSCWRFGTADMKEGVKVESIRSAAFASWTMVNSSSRALFALRGYTIWTTQENHGWMNITLIRTNTSLRSLSVASLNRIRIFPIPTQRPSIDNSVAKQSQRMRTFWCARCLATYKFKHSNLDWIS